MLEGVNIALRFFFLIYNTVFQKCLLMLSVASFLVIISHYSETFTMLAHVQHATLCI